MPPPYGVSPMRQIQLLIIRFVWVYGGGLQGFALDALPWWSLGLNCSSSHERKSPLQTIDCMSFAGFAMVDLSGRSLDALPWWSLGFAVLARGRFAGSLSMDRDFVGAFLSIAPELCRGSPSMLCRGGRWG